MILNALEGRPLPIYGDGGNVRDWLHVEDHCAGLLLVLAKGRPGEKYNIGGGNERTNLRGRRSASARRSNRCVPAAYNPALNGASYRALEDVRAGSARATIAATRSTRRRFGRELGWAPLHAFEEGLRETVAWYVEHRDWCEQRAGRALRPGAPRSRLMNSP